MHVHLQHPVDEVAGGPLVPGLLENARRRLFPQPLGEGVSVEVSALPGGEELHPAAIAVAVALAERARQPASAVDSRAPDPRGARTASRARRSPGGGARDERGDPVGARGRHVAVIPGEVLIAAVAVERDRHAAPGHLRDVEAGHRRGIGEGLAVVPGHLGNHRDQVGPDDQLLVGGGELLGDQPSVGELVPVLLLESDRERPDRLRRSLGHRRHDRRGVDAAGEEGAERDVRDHPVAHGRRISRRISSWSSGPPRRALRS